MIGIQILAILFALWMIYFSYLHFKRGEFGRIEFVSWQIIWIGLIVVVVFPVSVKFILNTFNITRTFDLVIIISAVVLYGVTFRNYVLLKRYHKQIENLIRKDAINKTLNKKNEDSYSG